MVERICNYCGGVVEPDETGSTSMYDPYRELYYCNEECWLEESANIIKVEEMLCEDCSAQIIHEEGEVYWNAKRNRNLCLECAMVDESIEYYTEEEEEEEEDNEE